MVDFYGKLVGRYTIQGHELMVLERERERYNTWILWVPKCFSKTSSMATGISRRSVQRLHESTTEDEEFAIGDQRTCFMFS